MSEVVHQGCTARCVLWCCAPEEHRELHQQTQALSSEMPLLMLAQLRNTLVLRSASLPIRRGACTLSSSTEGRYLLTQRHVVLQLWPRPEAVQERPRNLSPCSRRRRATRWVSAGKAHFSPGPKTRSRRGQSDQVIVVLPARRIGHETLEYRSGIQKKDGCTYSKGEAPVTPNPVLGLPARRSFHHGDFGEGPPRHLCVSLASRRNPVPMTRACFISSEGAYL
jgi:hypothetical protein